MSPVAVNVVLVVTCVCDTVTVTPGGTWIDAFRTPVLTVSTLTALIGWPATTPGATVGQVNVIVEDSPAPSPATLKLTVASADSVTATPSPPVFAPASSVV